MKKQEFLAMSLPHKLKVYVKYNHKPDNSELETMVGIVDDYIITDMHEEDMDPLSISNYGLCLRPLSGLNKPIEHKGQTFVPIERIFNMSGHYEIGANWFKQHNIKCLPFFIAQYLIELHFDIADLISKGEAIDVNTLDVNPYR